MKESDWGLEVIYADNGFVVKDNNGKQCVFQGKHEIEAGEELLWFILDFFNLRPNRYSKERLSIVREPGDKYVPGENES